MKQVLLDENIKSPLDEGLKKAGKSFLSYHRTRQSNVDSILKTGFYPGHGAMYGVGLYTTYDEESQFERNMQHYGDVVIRFKINPEGLLILDYNIAKEIYGSKYTLVDQLVSMRVFPDEFEVPKNLYEASEYLERSFKDPTESAHIAFQVIVCGNSMTDVLNNRLKYRSWQDGHGLIGSRGIPKSNKIRGLIFSGNHDGNVLVSYSTSCTVPDKYILNPDPIGKIPDEEEWVPVGEDLIDKSARRVSIADRLYNFTSGHITQIKIVPEDAEYDMDKFEKEFQWLANSKFKAKTLILDLSNKRDPKVDMEDTIWNRGEFNGRLFKGVFEAGKFIGEVFEGDFVFGTFKQGQFNGVWKDGLWKDGTWNGQRWDQGEIFQGGQFIPSLTPPAN